MNGEPENRHFILLSFDRLRTNGIIRRSPTTGRRGSMTPRSTGGPGTFVISDAHTLARITRDTAHFLGRSAYQHIEVALPVARRERFERQINARYRACGCFASASAALVVWNVVYSARSGYGWGDIALDVGLVLLAGAMGKVLALARAHWALKRTLRELASVFAAQQQRRIQ